MQSRKLIEESESKPARKNEASLRLVEKAIRGDRAALCALCEAISKDVFFHAMSLLGNRPDAEDVLQEVLMRVCENIPGLRDPAAFKSWLGRITDNEVNLHYKKEAGPGTVLSIDDYLDSLTEENGDFLPQEYGEREEYSREIAEAVNALPRRQRQAVFLHYYSGLEVGEAAEAMGVSVSTLSGYLALARERIKAELDARHVESGRRFNTLAVAPMGSVLTAALRREAENTELSPEIMRQALEKCGVSAQPGAASTAFKASALKALAGGVAAAAAVAGGLWAALPDKEAAPASPPPSASVTLADADGSGRIIFSGGMDRGHGYAWCNPGSAAALTAGGDGAITVVGWQITRARDEAVLYEGEGGDPDEALLRLRESGADGVYVLLFVMEDEAGSVYRMSDRFCIET